jgi:hypothetical protein
VKAITILDAMDAQDIWRPWFKRPQQWLAWRVFIKVLFGLPLSDLRELKLYRRCTGRLAPRNSGFLEAWLVIGRRGGKSFILALIACYLACFRDWKPYLAPGERGVIPIIAADRKQARTIFRYARALLTHVPALAKLVERADNDTITLTNGISIEIMTASYRSTRGYTIIAALCDEIAFWRTEETAANPDVEILDAVRPAMATIPGAMLLVASSPYAKRGALFEADRKHYGREGDPSLVWRCDTLTMHDDPHVRAVIDRAFEDDIVKAASEYGRDGEIQFRSDIESFISREAIDAVVAPGRFELPPLRGIAYYGFADPASGSGTDSFTIAVAHRGHDGRSVLDCVREWRPPFSPAAVCAEAAAVCRSYRLARVTGDHYAGEFAREPFRDRGINYDVSKASKSDIYVAALPIINSGQCELLDHPRLYAQLIGLERRVARSGRDSIDHSPGAHDDIANVVAGALTLVAASMSSDAGRILQIARNRGMPLGMRLGIMPPPGSY